MHRSQNKNKIILILLMMFGMFLGSCKGPLNLKDDLLNAQKVYITISTNLSDSEARTVLPTGFNTGSTGLSWTLTGTKEDSSKTISYKWEDEKNSSGQVITSAYSKMTSSDTVIELEEGNWTFELTVNNTERKKVLQSNLTQTISSDTDNLNFVMQEASGDDVAPGQIEFTLTFPTGVVDNVVATLTEYGENEATGYGGGGQVTLSENKDSVTYTNTVSAGTYMLKLDLKQQDPANTVQYNTINTYTCLIRVAPGLLSKGSDKLTSLAKLYKITYELDGGTMPENVTKTSYNQYTKFKLLTPERPGYEFLGWYTNEACSEKVDVDDEGYFSISIDTTLYAKWKPTTVNFRLKGKRKTDNGSNDYDELIENNTIKVPSDVSTTSDVWQYFVEVRPSGDENAVYTFENDKNYKVSLTLHSSVETVIAVAAARADMFFTVGTDEKTISFETGCLKEELKKYITIGVATKEADITLTKVEVESIEYNLNYSLGIMISREGINAYLNEENHKPEIVVFNYSNDECNLTLNSTGVTVDLRSYAPSGTGLYTASFYMSSTNGELKTSIYADCADDNASAWNGGKQALKENNEYNTLLPVYEASKECTVGIISNSEVTTELNISKLIFDKKELLEDALTEVDKIVAILNGESWNTENEVIISPTNNSLVNVTITDNFEAEDNPAWLNENGYCCRINKIPSVPEELNWQWNGQFSCHSVSSAENKQYKVYLNNACEIIVEEYIEDVGLTFDSSNGVILINNEIGLEYYRKIVNEEIESLSVPYINNTYSTMNVDCQYPAKLQNDVTVSNWVPIGTEEDPFYSSFDGGGYSITIEEMSSADCDYAGLFGCVQNATISNVVVEGEISSESAKYVGGIVAYCVLGDSSTTIKNCVNNATVNGSNLETDAYSNFAVGGIVGYAEGNCKVENSVNKGAVNNEAISNYKSTGGIIGMVGNNSYSITSCVNLAEIKGKANVAGIVAGINKDTLSPVINIDKCINAGAINSEALYLAGIACAASERWTSSITNSINLSALTGCSKAGIYYNAKSTSFDITYCMNVGQNSAGENQHNYTISNETGNISNCYYDSSKVIPGESDDNGTPKSTAELKTDTPFDSWSTEYWSFANDQYPLPNIGDNIPGGKDGEYWQAVLTAAGN